jgi:small subunit ribosomal protein S6e
MAILGFQSKVEAAEYHKLLVSRLKEARERRSESLAKKRAVQQASQASKGT